MVQKRSVVFGWLAACLLAVMVLSPAAYAGGSLPDGLQTFSGYTFASGVATSPDHFFTLQAYLGNSTTPSTSLQADAYGAYLSGGNQVQETVYFEIKASSTLGSFRLHSASIGEWGGTPNFSNVTVKGYVSGQEVFSTVPYTGPVNTNQLEYPIDYTAVQDIPIDSFRVYYTKEAGSNHSNFNLVSFTIGESSTQPPESPALTYGISLSPTADYTFAAAVAGYGAQGAQTVTVSNIGTGETGLLTVALSGADAAAFTLSKTSISSIAVSGSASFDIAPRTGLAAGNYTATVTVSGGENIASQSKNVSFTVNNPQLAITEQPQSVLALTGQTNTFHVVASGLDPLTYRWQRSTDAGASWEDIQGAASSDYTTSTLNMSHNGYRYRVIITDALNNSITSSIATLSVNTIPATGDTSHPLAYAFLAVIFAAVSMMLIRKRRSA